MPSLSTTQARINELSSIIHQYNHSYYSSIGLESNILTCNDETYDSMVSELKELEKQYPEFRLEDSPTIFVSGKPNTAFQTRTHKTPMLSLGNFILLKSY
jgi:NAD-dependent DNA ligase (contains BRCT domain type II)